MNRTEMVVNSILWRIGKLLRGNPESSQHKEKMFSFILFFLICEKAGLDETIVLIISHYV